MSDTGKRDDNETIREAMSILGRRMSARKRAALTANARKPRPGGRKPRKSLKDIECNCSGSGLDHRSYCKRGRAIRYRQARGLPLT